MKYLRWNIVLNNRFIAKKLDSKETRIETSKEALTLLDASLHQDLSLLQKELEQAVSNDPPKYPEPSAIVIDDHIDKDNLKVVAAMLLSKQLQLKDSNIKISAYHSMRRKPSYQKFLLQNTDKLKELCYQAWHKTTKSEVGNYTLKDPPEIDPASFFASYPQFIKEVKNYNQKLLEKDKSQVIYDKTDHLSLVAIFLEAARHQNNTVGTLKNVLAFLAEEYVNDEGLIEITDLCRIQLQAFIESLEKTSTIKHIDEFAKVVSKEYLDYFLRDEDIPYGDWIAAYKEHSEMLGAILGHNTLVEMLIERTKKLNQDELVHFFQKQGDENSKSKLNGFFLTKEEEWIINHFSEEDMVSFVRTIVSSNPMNFVKNYETNPDWKKFYDKYLSEELLELLPVWAAESEFLKKYAEKNPEIADFLNDFLVHRRVLTSFYLHNMRSHHVPDVFLDPKFIRILEIVTAIPDEAVQNIFTNQTTDIEDVYLFNETGIPTIEKKLLLAEYILDRGLLDEKNSDLVVKKEYDPKIIDMFNEKEKSDGHFHDQSSVFESSGGLHLYQFNLDEIKQIATNIETEQNRFAEKTIFKDRFVIAVGDNEKWGLKNRFIPGGMRKFIRNQGPLKYVTERAHLPIYHKRNKVLNKIAQSDKPLTIVMDMHASYNGPSRLKPGIYFTPKNIAEAYAERVKKLGPKKAQDLIIINCGCGGRIDLFAQAIKDMGLPVPIFISENEIGLLNYTFPSMPTHSNLFDRVFKGTNKDNPAKIKHIFEESWKPRSLTNPAIIVPDANGDPIRISQNSNEESIAVDV